jgi:hypothetical protein
MSHSFVIFLSSFLDEMALWFIFPCDFTFVVPNSGQNDVALIFPRDSVLVMGFPHKILPPFYHNSGFQVVMKTSQLFGIQKPTSQGMAKPCAGKWGSSN